MKRTTFRTNLRTILVAALIATAACLAMPRQAAAQCCTTFELWAGTSIPSGCYPLVVTTNWGAGAATSGPTTITGPGSVFLTAPTPPGCWPPILTSVTVNGVTFGFNVPPPLCVLLPLPCGYSMNVCFKTDPSTGCSFVGLN